MRQTHTTVLLEVSPAAFEEIERKLQAAGYDHVFGTDDWRPTADMQGITLVKDVPREPPT